MQAPDAHEVHVHQPYGLERYLAAYRTFQDEQREYAENPVHTKVRIAWHQLNEAWEQMSWDAHEEVPPLPEDPMVTYERATRQPQESK
jgi:hypothetical protein